MPRPIQKTADIRTQNKRKIVQCLLTNDMLTKKELGERAHLSVSTVSNLTAQLIEKNIVQIPCYQDSEGGRSPGLLSIDEYSRLFTAIHIYQNSAVQIQVLSLKKQVLLSFTQNVQEPCDAFAIYDACSLGVRRCETEVSGYSEKNLGIGVALPGIVEKKAQLLINSTIKELEGQPVLEELRSRMSYPVYGENESNLLALAVSFNPKKPVPRKDTIYLHIDDGLGIGIICNGELVRGSHGLGGEINTIPICFGVQRKRTLEEILVFQDFLRAYREKLGDPELTEAHFLEDAQSMATEEIQEILKEKGFLLGQLIAVLDALFDPTAFYIGGRVTLLLDQLYPFIQEAYQNNVEIEERKALSLFPCKNYQQQLMVGCADLVFDHWDFS